MKHKRKPQLNDGLCPEKFEICVPWSCSLLGDWRKETAWERYLQELSPDYELPGEYKTETCWTCDCKPGWLLRGELAVKHACQVHDRIHRQLLGFEQVSAVDVGFAIRERQTKFGDFLAIRIHVNRKLPAEQLTRAGLASFTQAQSAFPEIDFTPRDKDGDMSRCCDGPDADCPHPDRRKRVIEILRRESDRKQRLLKDLDRYPISGVRPEDLSIFCPLEGDEPYGEDPGTSRRRRGRCRKDVHPRTLDDIRLCICGVPIDIVNARYNPSVVHPGGDAASGVFVEPAQRSNQLGNDELLLIGRGRTNPLVGGVSVGSVTGQAGTLGTVVWDRTDGTPCILSNWHVLAGTAAAQIDQPTYQPALFDGGTEDDVVARLKRWHLGEEGDAAVAELTGDRYYASGEILGLWHPVSGSLKPRLNLEIRKWGRTTGFTRGFVDGIHLATNIDYGTGVVRYFRNQFHIAPLYAGDDVSQVGDSGSLVVTRYKPLDMQEDLVQLCRWLREACDSTETLCDDIRKDLEDLRERCPKSGYGKDLCDFIEKLDFSDCNPSPPCDVDLDALRSDIKSEQKKLDSLCKEARRDFKLYACLEAELEKLSERCSRCELDPTEELDEIFLCCYGTSFSDISSRRCGSPSPEIEVIVCDCLESPPTCKLVKCILDRVRNKRKHLEECADIEESLRFCRRAAQTFERWLKRCCRIERGKKLCRALSSTEEAEPHCGDSRCDDPATLVECIKKKLCEDDSLHGNTESPSCSYGSTGSPPRDDVEKIKGLLRSFLEEKTHDPDIFLKELKGSARRYRRRKKGERDRDVERVYYAVGMIFAGDTPGSPFGEFAVASDIGRLEKELRFSLRPVFEPRSSFRELRERPPGRGRAGRAFRSRRSLTPGAGSADPRGGGPQPDPELGQGDPD